MCLLNNYSVLVRMRSRFLIPRYQITGSFDTARVGRYRLFPPETGIFRKSFVITWPCFGEVLCCYGATVVVECQLND